MTNDPKTAPNAPANDSPNESAKTPSQAKPADIVAPAPQTAPIETKKT
jgi:hypothetical protein